MAALVPEKLTKTVRGGQRVRMARLPAVSDGDTWVTGLHKILEESVKITPNSAATVAADSIALDSVSGGTVTFQVAGTPRKANVQVEGY